MDERADGGGRRTLGRVNAAITIIVPGYQVEDWAGEALDSLRAQTFPHWRAVLVDDASTDATPRLFAAAAAADPRFRMVRHAGRQGLGAARNTGLDLVDTPYLGFLDADDAMTPHALARFHETLEATGSDFAVGAYVRLRPVPNGGDRRDGGSAGAYAAGEVQPWVAAATVPERHRTTLRDHPHAAGNIVAWSKVSRAAFWEGRRFPVGRAYEDQIVAEEMYVQAQAFDVLPDVCVLWRERADGTSITQGKDALPVLDDYLHAIRGGLAVLRDAGYEEALAVRLRLVHSLDLPPLLAIAETHPDPEYRRRIDAFLAELPA